MEHSHSVTWSWEAGELGSRENLWHLWLYQSSWIMLCLVQRGAASSSSKKTFQTQSKTQHSSERENIKIFLRSRSTQTGWARRWEHHRRSVESANDYKLFIRRVGIMQSFSGLVFFLFLCKESSSSIFHYIFHILTLDAREQKFSTRQKFPSWQLIIKKYPKREQAATYNTRNFVVREKFPCGCGASSLSALSCTVESEGNKGDE